MKIFTYFALVALMVAGTLLVGCGPPSNAEVANKALLLIGQKNLAEAAKVLNTDTDSLSTSLHNMGTVTKIGKTTVTKEGEQEVIIVNMEFSSGSVDAYIYFTKEGKVWQSIFLSVPARTPAAGGAK